MYDRFQDWGYGMASVRFICGTQTLHRQLEVRKCLAKSPTGSLHYYHD